jgi:hypothetical protein
MLFKKIYILAKKLAFFAQTTPNFLQKFDHNIGF